MSLLSKFGPIILVFVGLACGADEPQTQPGAVEAPAAATPTSVPALTSPTAAVIEIADTPTPMAVVQPTATAKSEAALFPVTIENCGIEFIYEAPPERAISLNQHVTELMLALGLVNAMVGTAYIDDFILPEFQDAYETIEVLAQEYPSREVILNAEPDFLYGGFGSAFNEENAGSQESLQALGINSYLTHAVCDVGPDTMEDVYSDITNIGAIFGVPGRADDLVSSIRADLSDIQSAIGDSSEPVEAFLYDSGDDAPYTSVCCAMITPLIEMAGGTNIFDDVAGRWSEVSWEEVIARDPDVIILTEAVWSTADEKIELLKNSPFLSEISAVQNDRYIVLRFSSMVPGIRNQTAIQAIAEGLYPDLFP